MILLRDEVAIVTGSSGLGSGSEIARLFAEEGAAVVVTGRNESRGRAVADAIVKTGGNATFIRADIGVESDCRSLVDATVAQFGRLTVLVNSAVVTTDDGTHLGALEGGGDGSVAAVTDAAWEWTMRINVTAVMWLCRWAIPAMQAAGHGSIVNIGSRVAERAAPNLSAYVASKGALNALTRSIAIDFAADNIRCNTVAAGYIRGKEREGALDPATMAWVKGMHLTAPPTTLDVARGAAYLASSWSSAVTGHTLMVDGGGTVGRALQMG